MNAAPSCRRRRDSFARFGLRGRSCTGILCLTVGAPLRKSNSCLAVWSIDPQVFGASQHWGDIMRHAASIRDKSLKPSAILRKPGACRQQNRPCLALGEIGRTERTLFMLDWIENADQRMECQAGLDKGEARHSLARAVFAHSQGGIHDRSGAARQKRAMALDPVIASISFWNAIYMDKAATHLAKTSPLYDPDLLRHASPLGWNHIILSGDFDWHSGAAERKIARPPNIKPAGVWGTLQRSSIVPLRVILPTNLPMGPCTARQSGRSENVGCPARQRCRGIFARPQGACPAAGAVARERSTAGTVDRAGIKPCLAPRHRGNAVPAGEWGRMPHLHSSAVSSS